MVCMSRGLEVPWSETAPIKPVSADGRYCGAWVQRPPQRPIGENSAAPSLMGQEQAPPAIVFYFALTASLMGLLTAPFGWVWPTPQVAMLLVASGPLLGGVGQLMMTASYRYADASAAGPLLVCAN